MTNDAGWPLRRRLHANGVRAPECSKRRCRDDLPTRPATTAPAPVR